MTINRAARYIQISVQQGSVAIER